MCGLLGSCSISKEPVVFWLSADLINAKVIKFFFVILELQHLKKLIYETLKFLNHGNRRIFSL